MKKKIDLIRSDLSIIVRDYISPSIILTFFFLFILALVGLSLADKVYDTRFNQRNVSSFKSQSMTNFISAIMLIIH